MKKFFAGVVAVLLLMVGVMFSNSIQAKAEDQAAAPAAPAVAAPAEVAKPADAAAAVEPAMDDSIDEAKVLKDAAAKLKGIANDPEAAKLAKQLEDLASDYEY